MKLFNTMGALAKALSSTVRIGRDGTFEVTDRDGFRNEVVDPLVRTAVFAEDGSLRDAARWLIRCAAREFGIILSSIQDLYMAVGRGECGGFTVPAINVRGMTYDVARAIIRTARNHHAGAFIFEIARSEIGYTFQRPAEYAASVTAAAIKEDYQGPLFIQGDHFQVKASGYKKDPDRELQGIRELIQEAIEAGFYQIDVDSSTIVELSHPTVEEQQRANFEVCADLTNFIRSKQPEGVMISVGGEIGEVGGKNSTVEELRAFMGGLNARLEEKAPGQPGISKISIQTGTTHGGIPLPDGSIAEVKLDFEALEQLSRASREEYGLGGAVQHGASTLPNELFDKFPETGTLEVHLATQFQNMIYDHPKFPAELREEIYAHLNRAHGDERKEGQTDEQFLYKLRKKGFGPFKKQVWELPDEVRQELGRDQERQFDLLFTKLRVTDTASVVANHVKPCPVEVPMPESLKAAID